MKRLAILFSAVGLLALGVIASDTVNSVNTVGFRRITILSNHIAMVGIPFDTIDTNNQTLVGVLGTNQLRPGSTIGSANADKVMIWNTSLVPPQYQTFALKPSSPLPVEYFDTDNWGTATNPPIKAGQAIWIKLGPRSGDTTITLSGEVVDVATQSTDIVMGPNMVAYPFSESIRLKDTAFERQGIVMAGNISAQKGDQIWVWNGMGYDQYAMKKSDTNWYDANNWSSGLANDVLLDMGKGFWFRRQTNTVLQWTETNRYINNL